MSPRERREELKIEDSASTNSAALNTNLAGCTLYVGADAGLPSVNIVGEVDLESASKVYSQIWQASERGKLSLVLNVEQLDFMDSSGLQVLLRLREKLRARKQTIYLVAPQPQIRKIFKLTGFDKLFHMVDQVDEINRLTGN